MKLQFNERHYTVFAVLLVILMSYLFAPADLGLRELVIVKLTYVAIFLGTVGGLLYFLRGTSYDVIGAIFPPPAKEVATEDEPLVHALHAVAVALFIVGMLIAFALVIGR